MSQSVSQSMNQTITTFSKTDKSLICLLKKLTFMSFLLFRHNAPSQRNVDCLLGNLYSIIHHTTRKNSNTGFQLKYTDYSLPFSVKNVLM